MSFLIPFINHIKLESALNVRFQQAICDFKTKAYDCTCSFTRWHATIHPFRYHWRTNQGKSAFVQAIVLHLLERLGAANRGHLACWPNKCCGTQTVVSFIWTWIIVSIVQNWCNKNVSICFSLRHLLRSMRRSWGSITGSIRTRTSTWCACLLTMATMLWMPETRLICNRFS